MSHFHRSTAIMASKQEQIRELEEEIKKTQYNKATQHHIGRLKAKMARLKGEIELQHRKKSGGGSGYHVKKSGHATVALVGLPSVGKSTILNTMTGANSEVAAYQFTTLTVVPGVLQYRHARIQILDLPGIIKGASHGKGGGREILAAVRSADLILFIVDPFHHNMDLLDRELHGVAIRTDATYPDVRITKADKGGIIVSATRELTKLNEETITTILKEYGIVNAHVVIREDISDDQLIDVLTGNRAYIPSLPIINKMDLAAPQLLEETLLEIKEFYAAKGILNKEICRVSASKQEGTEELKEKIYEMLHFINIYLKPIGKKADMEEPLVVKLGSDVGMVCDHLHRDFRRLFRYAIVWGKSAKFPGQTVGLDHKMADGDLLTIVTHLTG